MKKVKETRDRVFRDCVEMVERGNVVAVSINLGDREGTAEFFVHKKDLLAAQKSNKDIFDALETIEKKYFFYNKKFRDRLYKYGVFVHKRTDYDILDHIWDAAISPFRALSHKDYSEDKLLYFCHDSYLFYRPGEKNPVSLPLYMGYINGGVTNRNFDLERAQAALESSPYVSNIEKIEIPYYNQEDDYTHAIEFLVCVPQDIYDHLCTYFRDVVKAECWTCMVEEMFNWNFARDISTDDIGIDLDFFGLKSCYHNSK